MNAAALAASLWNRPIGLNRVKSTQAAPGDQRGCLSTFGPKKAPHIRLAARILSRIPPIIELCSNFKATCGKKNQKRCYLPRSAAFIRSSRPPLLASPLVRSDPCQFQVAPRLLGWLCGSPLRPLTTTNHSSAG